MKPYTLYTKGSHLKLTTRKKIPFWKRRVSLVFVFMFFAGSFYFSTNTTKPGPVKKSPKNVSIGSIKDVLAPRLKRSFSDAEKQNPDAINETAIQVTDVYEKIPYPTRHVLDRKILYGKQVVVQKGKSGLLKKRVKFVYENGVKVEDVVLSETLIQKPVPEVVAKGTIFVMASRAKWKYPPKKQVKKIIEMTATAYSPFYSGGHPIGQTRSGTKAGYGVVAVDPKVIPLGTYLFIPGYGYAKALDTGGAIKGKRIDLCYDTLEEVKEFEKKGPRKVKVYVLK